MIHNPSTIRWSYGAGRDTENTERRLSFLTCPGDFGGKSKSSVPLSGTGIYHFAGTIDDEYAQSDKSDTEG